MGKNTEKRYGHHNMNYEEEILEDEEVAKDLEGEETSTGEWEQYLEEH